METKKKVNIYQSRTLHFWHLLWKRHNGISLAVVQSNKTTQNNTVTISLPPLTTTTTTKNLKEKKTMHETHQLL